MKIYKTISSIKKDIAGIKKNHLSVGFVPTMGALHEGHISLVRRSMNENEKTVVSIFLNPIQFDNKEDLNEYPKTIEEDLLKLRNVYCDIAFCPTEEEIFKDFTIIKYDFGNLENEMEGKFRKGHFNGVANIVYRLFEIVSPDRAYFGEKDFQQLVIIKKMTKDLKLPVEIIPCSIVRENNGLALSSRNKLLSPEQYMHAPYIRQILLKAKKYAMNHSLEETKQWVRSQFASHNIFSLEYFEIVDNEHLNNIVRWDEGNVKVGCIAVKTGMIRLIDNIIF